MPNPFGERQTLIACEGEGLASCRCVPGYVGCDNKDEDHASKSVDAGCADCCGEDVDERVARWIIDGIVNACDGEQVSDQQNDRQDAVSEITPED